MAKHHLTMKYMKAFKCVGSECEMSCCVGWNVTLTKKETNDLAAVIATHPGINPGFVENVDTEAETNLMPQRESGRCMMLCKDDLCTVHTAAGEAALPYVCASYPRSVHSVGDRMELTAKTSCPEITRILLLDPDATTRVSCDKDLFPRYRPQQVIDNPTALPWTKYLDDIRNLALEMLSLPYPMSHRMFFLTEVSKRLTPILNVDTQKDPGDQIQTVLEPLLQKNNLEATHEHLNRLNWEAEEVLPLVLNLLTIRSVASRGRHQDPMRLLYASVCKYSGLNPVDIEGSSKILWPLHRARSVKLTAQWGEQLEGYAARFAQHYWLHELFPKHPSLNAYMCRLLLLSAVHRLLLVNHPEIAKYLDADTEVPKEVLEQTAIRVVSKVTRNMEHNEMINEVLKALSPVGSFPLVQKLCFI